LVLSNPNPGGIAFPSSSVLTEPLYLRMDKSRLGEIMALGRDADRMDPAMDIVIVFGLTKSCLSSSNKSSDFVLKAAESTKFAKDRRCNPISSSPTMRFIPFPQNHLGLRGPHFQAMLKEFATILVTKPEVCSLLRGAFALTHTGALHKIMRSWGTRLTWTAQREHASQIVRGMQSFYDYVAFMTQWDEGGMDEMGVGG